MRKFRLLQPEEIECRVARVTKTGVQLLLYKTARTDAALLDEAYPDAWQNDFKALDGKMYCGIGIKIKDEWIWRWDCGAESNMEAEKGEASDAFKRAGFKWGLGTELYSSPFIFIPSDKCTIDNGKCFDRFKVMSIGYGADEKINSLDIDNLTMRCSAFHLAPKTEGRAEKLRQQILELARIKSIAEEKVTGADYNGRKWDELGEDELVSVKVRLAKR